MYEEDLSKNLCEKDLDNGNQTPSTNLCEEDLSKNLCEKDLNNGNQTPSTNSCFEQLQTLKATQFDSILRGPGLTTSKEDSRTPNLALMVVGEKLDQILLLREKALMANFDLSWL